jgi:hypothetical protein
MLELGRKEQHLMGGIGFNILIVGLLVFAYTQAIRQVKLSKDLSLRRREQLTVAREQVAREGGKAETAKLQAKLEELKSSLVPQNALEPQAHRLERMAQERFGIRDAKVKAGDAPSEKISVPLEGRTAFEVHLYSLEMKGTAGSRGVAGLLSGVGDPSFKPLCPLVAMELQGGDEAGSRPVEFTLKWMMAVSPDSTASPGEALPPAGRPAAWGWREEPFRSALAHPSALRVPEGKQASLRLSGILQEEASSTCVINGQVLKAGDWVSGYQVVLITPDAVLLEGKGEELLLRLP